MTYSEEQILTCGFKFSFDKIFSCASEQDEVNEEIGENIVDNLIEGYNYTLVAYGQTASGKTYTMVGDMKDDKATGLIPYIVHSLFSSLEVEQQTADAELSSFKVQLCLLEVYLDRVRDLLHPNFATTNLKIREDSQKGIKIVDSTWVDVNNDQHFMSLLNSGQERRETSQTFLNEASSRSHLIVLISLEQTIRNDDGSESLINSTLCLADLAGSEKLDKTNASGKQLFEARNINKSLSSLGAVIKSITSNKNAQNRKHIPYRNSKLTRILQSGLGGNGKASFVLCCSPSIFNYEETLSTLRFGKRMKLVQSKATIGKSVICDKVKLQQMLLNANLEIKRLKENKDSKHEPEKENNKTSANFVSIDKFRTLSEAPPIRPFNFKQELSILRTEMETENQKLKQEILSLKQPKTEVEASSINTKGNTSKATITEGSNVNSYQGTTDMQDLKNRLTEAQRINLELKRELDEVSTRIQKGNVSRDSLLLKSKHMEVSLMEKVEKLEMEREKLKREVILLQSKLVNAKQSMIETMQNNREAKEEEGDNKFRAAMIDMLRTKISNLLLENKRLESENEILKIGQTDAAFA